MLVSFDHEKAITMVKELDKALLTLRQDWGKVSSNWRNLEITWHDKHRIEFEEEYGKLLSSYAHVEQELEDYKEFLLSQIRKYESGSF